MWPDRVSNPGPLTYESGALPTALRGPAYYSEKQTGRYIVQMAEKEEMYPDTKLVKTFFLQFRTTCTTLYLENYEQIE